MVLVTRYDVLTLSLLNIWVVILCSDTVRTENEQPIHTKRKRPMI